jgi:hydroxyacylglutathione hydrolase
MKTSPSLQVFAGKDDKIEQATKTFSEPSLVDFDEFTLQVFPVPCHTRGHVLYFFEYKEAVPPQFINEKEGEGVFQRVVFTGDTIFLGGCGRFFEGSGLEMLKNFDRFLSLPDETRVYCGHEYAVESRKFSSSVDPDNKEARALYENTVKRIQEGYVSIPGTVGEERRTNIFARAHEKEIMALVKESDSEKTMTRLREMKNKGIVKV